MIAQVTMHMTGKDIVAIFVFCLSLGFVVAVVAGMIGRRES